MKKSLGASLIIALMMNSLTAEVTISNLEGVLSGTVWIFGYRGVDPQRIDELPGTAIPDSFDLDLIHRGVRAQAHGDISGQIETPTRVVANGAVNSLYTRVGSVGQTFGRNIASSEAVFDVVLTEHTRMSSLFTGTFGNEVAFGYNRTAEAIRINNRLLVRLEQDRDDFGTFDYNDDIVLPPGSYEIVARVGTSSNFNNNSTPRPPSNDTYITFSVAFDFDEEADFAHPGASLRHEYLLNGSLDDTFGGPSLVTNGSTVGSDTLPFNNQDGASLEGGIDPETYSIEIYFTMLNPDPFDFYVNSTFLDFNGSPTSGRGVHYSKFSGLSAGNNLRSSGTDIIDFAHPIHLVLTRSGETREFKAYLNGVEQLSGFDYENETRFSGANQLIHFLKGFGDGQYTVHEGAIDFIRIYDGVLTAAEVGELYDNTDDNQPPPSDPPVVEITTPLEGQVFGNPSVAVSANVTHSESTTVISTPAGIDTMLAAGGGTVSGAVTLLSEGENVISVNATDASSNAGGDAVNVILDTVAPTVTIVSPLEGSVSGVSPLSLTVDILDLTATTVDIGGNLFPVPAGGGQVTGLVALNEGNNPITVTATDAADNEGSATVNIVLDRSAPMVRIESPLEGACFGAGEETIAVTATINDLTATTVTSTPAGVSQALPAGGGIVPGSVTLSEGSNAVTVYATDEADLTGSSSITVVLDTTGPAITITSPGDGDAVSGTIDVDAEVADPAPGSGVASVDFEVDGTPIASLAAEPYGILLDTVTLTDGSHTITVMATDGKGNTSSSSVDILVDNTAPTLTITEPLLGDFVSGNAPIGIVASDDTSGVVTVEVLADGMVPTDDPSATFATPQASVSLLGGDDTTTRPDGSLSLTARAVDDAGNESLASVVVTVDNTAPEKLLVTPVDGETVSGTIPITASATDQNLSSIEILVDDQSVGTAATSPFTVNFDTTFGLDGAMTVEVVVTDLAGNTTLCVATVFVDNTKASLKPKSLNLKAKKIKSDITLTLQGPSLDLLLPTEDHAIELHVPGGSPIRSVQGWDGDDAVSNGNKLEVLFDRPALVNSILAGIAGGQIQPNSSFGINVMTDGWLLETVLVSIKGP